MSRSQKFSNEDNGKTFRDTSARGLESAIQCTSAAICNRSEAVSTSKACRPMLSTQSDGNIIRSHDQAGLKQKLVNKVKQWGSKGGHNNDSASSSKSDANRTDITLDLENLTLTNDTSEDTMYGSDLVNAKDSLENLIGHKTDKAVNGEVNPKLAMYPSSREKEFPTEMPASDPFLGGSSVSDCSTSRILTWDPWNKLGRKNKRENKRRKSPHNGKDVNRNGSPQKKSKDHTVGDESRAFAPELVNAENSDMEFQEYEYQPYRQARKSVEFVNEVLVVYFTGDEVVGKCTEPLKKELDQQIRNKEMRRGHIPCTMMGKKCLHCEDYMAAWFKR